MKAVSKEAGEGGVGPTGGEFRGGRNGKVESQNKSEEEINKREKEGGRKKK